jgi:perosamine synthetase
MNRKFIPVCEPLLSGNEKEYIRDAIDTAWISSAGKYIAPFEEQFAAYLGVKHAVAVINGTAALHLALVAIGVGEGDEIIIPNFTMIATAFAVAYTGAKPVFIDCEAETWNIDPTKIEEKINSRTKAIMPVHIWGHPCEMDAINEIAEKHELLVIEDAAESHGAEYKGQKCGSLSDIGCFSFFANKVITTGEGGMVVTNNDKLAEKCRYLKNMCFPLGGNRNYEHEDVGFNYRMSNLHAAIGLAQVEKLDDYVEMRRQVSQWYHKHLDIPGVIFQPELPDCKNVYWMNALVIDPNILGLSREDLLAKLKKNGVDSRTFFVGMNRQPSLIKLGCQCDGTYPISDQIAKNGFYLPSGSGLEEGDIMYICDVFKSIIC